jgi:hypothetical protein
MAVGAAALGASQPEDQQMTTTTSTNPWEPIIAPELAACGPVYSRLMQALHAASRTDEEMPTLAAIVTIVELASELMITSGALWTTPDLVDALRRHVDYLEQRRKDEPPAPVSATLREWFASARPPVAN